MAESRLLQMLQRQEDHIKSRPHRLSLLTSWTEPEPDQTNPRRVSMQSDSSKDHAIYFKTDPPSANHRNLQKCAANIHRTRSRITATSSLLQMLQRQDDLIKSRPHRLSLLTSWTEPEPEPDQTNPRRVSMQSDSSKDHAIYFKTDPPSANHSDSVEGPGAAVSMMEPILEEHPPDLSLDKVEMEQKGHELEGPEETERALVFRKLDENLVSLVKSELRRFQKVLTSEDPGSSAAEEDDAAGVREAFLKITLSFLRSMKQDKMADVLLDRQTAARCGHKLKAHLQQRFSQVSEGVATAAGPAPLQQIYTELYITEGGAMEANQEHEVRQIETHRRSLAGTPLSLEDLFTGHSGTVREGPPGLPAVREGSPAVREGSRAVRAVMTVGVAGVGKTLLTQKVSLDWAEGRAHQDVQLLFPFSFRELNVLKDRRFSLLQLLQHFFHQTKGLHSFDNLQLLFILDGLDECRLPLDFSRTQVLTEPTESASVQELLVNLIRGSLLPSARLWITTRPAAANQIPAECVSMVTEVRGFSDPQKEQYFRKRFRDEQQATAVISHIKSIRSLFIMCYIPVFCWILSNVLENLLSTTEEPELPRTLTNLYIHLLVVLLKQKNVKYDGKLESAPIWTPENQQMVKALAKLAFEQLQKGNLIFYESDLSECGLDASVYSGVLTEVFREEPGLYRDKVYCFIHLSVQEFLAALHVHQTFILTGSNLLLETRPALNLGRSIRLHAESLNLVRSVKLNTEVLHCSAVDQALQSPHGQLDLLLRFLLGLSLEENQRLLKGLVPQAEGSSSSKTIEHIKQRLNQGVSPEQSLNLLHCLNELHDHSLVQQIQAWTSAGRVCDRDMSPAQWGALSFILLSSHSDLPLFDLRSFCPSERALLGLLPVVRASTAATLSQCGLSSLCCAPLASVLSSSALTLLDLSDNDLQDSGVKDLCAGLRSAPCRLESLSLSGCLLTEDGCGHLTSALTSNPSHLRHLDLRYNHPGERGARLLQALKGPQLQSLRLEPCGQHWLKPGLRKYFQELMWDLNSVHRRLRFSDRLTAVMYVNDEQSYEERPERFDWFYQVLCAQELSGRCYFQVRWSGAVQVGVAYSGLQRKGRSAEAVLGGNERSWCLSCSDRGFSVWHKNQETVLPLKPGPHSQRAVGVFVDTEAGLLSFFSVSHRLTLLHSLRTVFSQPLVAAFGFRFEPLGSTVILCPAQELSVQTSTFYD